ncbi:hypothetical protein [Nocardia ninae]|uniref:Uncharacterized protein n=1 Tax=Nocardia ninae NBRC 108245 TaxID=1210091 RepID=A0A511MCZ3_9NOCA|nr:hypothetical protein [Nocardia ninae]GEM38545.1 hypothetical protein NN4_30640 [Nocardia ninae NBRC 108245]
MTVHINPKHLDMSELRQKVWAKPSTPDVRPYLIEYMRREMDRARALTNRELLSGKGGDVSANICGALIWPSVVADDEIGWLTEKSEPELSRALDLACKLDVDDDQAAWDELFQIVEKLQ